MKKNIIWFAALLFGVALFFISCKKETNTVLTSDVLTSDINKVGGSGHLIQTKTFSSDVAQKWLDMQLRNLRLPAGPNIYGLNGHRYFSYCAVALYESIVPGMPSYQSLHGQLVDMPQMPVTEPGKDYHWPSCANAALAFMNKSFFNVNMVSMDSLENALNMEYQLETDSSTFQRSVNFGKAVAQLIYDWSKTDGALTIYPTYVPPIGPGLWAPTPPNFPAALAPHWGSNRLMVKGSLDGTDSPAPPVYSTDPNSAYYGMAKDVFDVSQTLTPDQIALALYYRDNPGYASGTHYLVTFNDVMHHENPTLDSYALAMAKLGIVFNASFIDCWKLKYFYNQERPITYIRQVLGHRLWSPLFNTPGFPDFPSGHCQNAGAFAFVMTSLLGNNYSFTLHTYDYLGMAPRPYSSFYAMADDVIKARLYAGIHYRYSCVEGERQGIKIAQNVLNILQFQKP